MRLSRPILVAAGVLIAAALLVAIVHIGRGGSGGTTTTTTTTNASDPADGAETADAVKRLQTDLGIDADGRVGPETVDAFHKAVADGTLKTPTTTGTTT